LNHFREREVKCCAFPDDTVGPDATAVTVDDSLDRCETDAGPGKLSLRVKPLKGRE
jgi:hypothetical protein